MKLIINILLILKVDSIIELIKRFCCRLKVARYEKLSGQKINFVPQGSSQIALLGDLKKFKIHPTSHLKSDSVIECSGGVEIGRYFHSGRGLTIFSTNHNYNSDEYIPYGKESIVGEVVIKDFVWLGSNVTIVPGVTIGEGVVIGAGSVVTRNVPDCAIIGGNPAKVIKYRDKDLFLRLKKEEKFF